MGGRLGGRAGGRTDGRASRRAGGRAGGRTGGRADGRADGRAGGRENLKSGRNQKDAQRNSLQINVFNSAPSFFKGSLVKKRLFCDLVKEDPFSTRHDSRLQFKFTTTRLHDSRLGGVHDHD